MTHQAPLAFHSQMASHPPDRPKDADMHRYVFASLYKCVYLFPYKHNMLYFFSPNFKKAKLCYVNGSEKHVKNVCYFLLLFNFFQIFNDLRTGFGLYFIFIMHNLSHTAARIQTANNSTDNIESGVTRCNKTSPFKLYMDTFPLC